MCERRQRRDPDVPCLGIRGLDARHSTSPGNHSGGQPRGNRGSHRYHRHDDSCRARDRHADIYARGRRRDRPTVGAYFGLGRRSGLKLGCKRALAFASGLPACRRTPGFAACPAGRRRRLDTRHGITRRRRCLTCPDLLADSRIPSRPRDLIRDPQLRCLTRDEILLRQPQFLIRRGINSHSTINSRGCRSSRRRRELNPRDRPPAAPHRDGSHTDGCAQSREHAEFIGLTGSRTAERRDAPNHRGHNDCTVPRPVGLDPDAGDKHAQRCHTEPKRDPNHALLTAHAHCRLHAFPESGSGFARAKQQRHTQFDSGAHRPVLGSRQPGTGEKCAIGGTDRY